MNLDKILTSDEVVSSIEDNLESILELIPELRNEIDFPHNHPHHHLDVWQHTLLALFYSKNDLQTRMALLLHDIGKPFCFQDEEVRHFHGHADVSAVMAKQILERLGYDYNFIKRVVYLIKMHDTEITKEEIEYDPELMIKRLHVQECDSKAHHPDYQAKRLAYVEEIKKLIKEVTMDKKKIREQYKAIRKNLPDKDKKSEAIFNALINDPVFQEAQVIALYNSTKDEVDTHKLIEYLKEQGKTVCLPRVMSYDLIFFGINEKTRYQTSKFGITEPTNGLVYAPEKIDLVIVPGIAFDKEGNRIGYGGGYYDRYLEWSKLPSIAICFQEQILDEPIPTEEYDMKVDIIQTDKERYYGTKGIQMRKQKQ